MRKILSKYTKVPVSGRLRMCINLAKSVNIANKVILDIGCSDGLLAYHLLKENPKSYIGIDPSQKAIEFAKANIHEASFYVSPADKLPVKDNSVDVVLMFDVLEHVPPQTEIKSLKEIKRVLKKKGTLLLSTPNSNIFTNLLDPAWYFGHRHYKPQRVQKLLSQAGFKAQDIETRGGLWFSVYLIWIYFLKWIFKVKVPRNRILEELDDKQFDKKGIHTIFVKAQAYE